MSSNQIRFSGNPNLPVFEKTTGTPSSDQFEEGEELDGLYAEIVRKYGVGSLEKLRRRKPDEKEGKESSTRNHVEMGVVSGSLSIPVKETLESLKYGGCDGKDTGEHGSKPKDADEIENKNTEGGDVIGRKLETVNPNPNMEKSDGTMEFMHMADTKKTSWSNIIGKGVGGRSVNVISSLDLGSFFIASQLFVIRPWKLFVENEAEELKTLPIWVVLKRFPMEMLDAEGFNMVGSTIGEPLFTNQPTKTMSRTSFARVYIKVDTKCKYPKEVTVVLDQRKAITIPIEYNWKPPICHHCDVFGHTDNKCPKKPKVPAAKANVWVQRETKEKSNNESGQQSNKMPTKPILEESWEVPKQKHIARRQSGDNGDLNTSSVDGNVTQEEKEKEAPITFAQTQTIEEDMVVGSYKTKEGTHGKNLNTRGPSPNKSIGIVIKEKGVA
ncbi:hypothetical protein FRX31_031815, partial [Thalictrum thalictroides]